MAINFPTSIDTLTNPGSSDPQNSPSHSGQHADANDILEAIEAKVGVDSSAVTTSHDYKIDALETTSHGVNDANTSSAPALGADDNYVTNAEKTVIGDTSNTNTGDEIVATGAEVDTGTDDVKYASAKALKDSHNVGSVAPSTDGNVMTSNGTDWVSETPAATVVKATGAELDTGTDDAKFATAKALADSDYTKSALPLAGGTMTGDIQLGETDIKLDAVLSADEKWSGVTIPGTAGATLAVGDICFLQTADSKWELVDGILDGTDLGFKLQLGICVLAANADAATEMLVYGKVRSAAFPAFTVGAPVYLSDTAGDLVVAQPSTTNFAIRVVGYAISAEELMFNPSNDYIIHA